MTVIQKISDSIWAIIGSEIFNKGETYDAKDIACRG